MSTTLQRSPLTGALLTQLQAFGKPVGDGVLPDSAWLGQPNLPASSFEPFAVLSELQAGRSSGPLGDTQSTWQVPYMCEYFGVSRAQVEWLADRLRAQLDPLRYQLYVLGPSKWKVQQIRTDSLGSPTHFDSFDPPVWHQQDGMTVWLTKSRN